jgi:hypothetical protein
MVEDTLSLRLFLSVLLPCCSALSSEAGLSWAWIRGEQERGSHTQEFIIKPHLASPAVLMCRASSSLLNHV